MRKIRIKVTKLNEYPVYSCFINDDEVNRDEYRYLGCIGSPTFDGYEEWMGFEDLVRFLLGNCRVELPYDNDSYSTSYSIVNWEDEFDSYCIEKEVHSFGDGCTINVETGDLYDWKNSTLEDFTKELGIVLGVRFEVIR